MREVLGLGRNLSGASRRRPAKSAYDPEESVTNVRFRAHQLWAQHLAIPSDAYPAAVSDSADRTAAVPVFGSDRYRRGLRKSYYSCLQADFPACLYTFPSFITNSTFSNTLMFVSGSPLTATRSAYLPGLIDPISLECPSKSAAFEVAA